MDVICTWYHSEPRLIRTKPGEGISHSLCEECRERFNKEVEDYVEKLRKHGAQAEEPALSCR